MKNPLRAAVARARFRQQPAPVRFAIADDIDFLVGAHWDAVAAHRGVFLQRDYLRALAGARPTNLELRFVLLYEGSEPIAALVLQLVTIDGTRLHKATTKTGLAGAISRAGPAHRRASR